MGIDQFIVHYHANIYICKITKSVTRRVFRSQNDQKCVRPRLHPHPAGVADSTPQTAWLDYKGKERKEKGRGRGKEEKVGETRDKNKGEGKGGKGEGDGCSP